MQGGSESISQVGNLKDDGNIDMLNSPDQMDSESILKDTDQEADESEKAADIDASQIALLISVKKSNAANNSFGEILLAEPANSEKASSDKVIYRLLMASIQLFDLNRN